MYPCATAVTMKTCNNTGYCSVRLFKHIIRDLVFLKNLHYKSARWKDKGRAGQPKLSGRAQPGPELLGLQPGSLRDSIMWLPWSRRYTAAFPIAAIGEVLLLQKQPCPGNLQTKMGWIPFTSHWVWWEFIYATAEFGPFHSPSFTDKDFIPGIILTWICHYRITQHWNAAYLEPSFTHYPASMHTP